MMGSGGQPQIGTAQPCRCQAELLSWTHVKDGSKPSASHTSCLVQDASLTYEILIEQLDFHMGFLKTKHYYFYYFFSSGNASKNSLLKFCPDSLLHFGTPQLGNRKLLHLFSCLSPTHFSSPRAMTDIGYFFQNFKIRYKELCPVFIRAEVIFLPRKANDLSELLLPSNTKTASLMRLQGLDLWECESHCSLPYSAPYVTNKVLGGRQETGTTGNAQVITDSQPFLFAEVVSPWGTLLWFIGEKPTADRPEEYHWTSVLVWGKSAFWPEDRGVSQA